MTATRPVVVSAGASEPRGMIITERKLQDLSACTFRTALAASDAAAPAPADLADVTPTFSHGTGSTVNNVATVHVTCDSDNMEAGRDYRQWVELTDGGSVYVLPCPEILHAT